MSYDSMNAYEDTVRVINALIRVIEANPTKAQLDEAVAKARQELAEIAQDVEDMC